MIRKEIAMHAKSSQVEKGMKGSQLTLGIICPVPIEYKACRDVLKLSGEKRLMGRLASSKLDKRLEIIAVQAGPGKIRCASATQLVIDRYTPDVIMDVGGAGSLSPEISFFDVICAEKAYEYDICPVEEFSRYADDLMTHTILNDLTEEGRKVFRQFSSHIKNKISLNLKTGDIACGERNVDNKILRDKLHDLFNASACNWETSAVLKTAQLSGVKALSFRVITDEASEDMEKELAANWRNALLKLYAVLDDLLTHGWLFRLLNCLKTESRI